MDYEPKYTVVLRGQEFVLTKSQIEFDSPNYFTACFLGDFREAQTKRLEISRNPELFKLIMEHLCGYDILPLDDNAVPSHVSLDTVLRNLRADALFYQLEALVEACEDIIDPSKTNRSYMVIGYTTISRIVNDASVGKLTAYQLEEITTRMEPGKVWTTIVSEDMLSQMGPLQLADSFSGFKGLRAVAAIEGFTRKAVKDYHKLGWTLMSWRAELVTSGKAELLVVLKPLDSRQM
ncbi:putative BTB domain protein [Rhizoctonia solani 123E]|uniref:Putative BTB domain protein n=1 Tax=Rhizoctonia solani 123E TaxID=1423351 RepID=A0A074RGK9_9AGAM|nr:putative BTB domain protein [Rhizoctonia solani 123E]